MLFSSFFITMSLNSPSPGGTGIGANHSTPPPVYLPSGGSIVNSPAPVISTSPSPQSSAFVGAGQSQSLTAYANYSSTCTFGETHLSFSYSDFDVGDSVCLHFGTTRTAADSSGVPAQIQGKLFIQEVSPSVCFLPSHWANATYSAAGTITVWDNVSLQLSSPKELNLFVSESSFCAGDGKYYNSTSNSGTILVNPDPCVPISDNGKVLPPTTTQYIDTNTSLSFLSSASGGTPPYSYQWYTNGTALSGQTSATYVKDFKSPGDYKIINVCLTDATGYTVISNSISESVAYPPQVNLTTSQSSVDANQIVEFYSNEIHGNGKLAFEWTLNGTSISGATGRDYNASFSHPGNYTIGVSVEDQTGSSASSTTVERVYPPISSRLEISQKYIDVGQKINFKLNVSGSSGSYNSEYSLKFTPTYGGNTLISGSGLTFNFSFPTNSPYICYSTTLNWEATSSTGAVTYGNDSLICVHVDPSISVSLKYSSRDAGQFEKICTSGPNSNAATIGPYNGWKPYDLTFYSKNLTTGNLTVLGTNDGNETTQDLGYIFQKAGDYGIFVALRDSAGYVVNSSCSEVSILPSFKLAEKVNPPQIVNMHNTEVCSQICIESTKSGGSSVASGSILVNGYAYCAQNSLGDSTLKIQHSMPSNPGNYSYCVQETDTNGVAAKARAYFNISKNDMSVSTNVPTLAISGDAYSLSATASAPSYISYIHSFNLVGYSYIWHVDGKKYSGKNIVYDFQKSGTYTVNLTSIANYVVGYNGLQLTAFQEKNTSMTVHVINSTSSTDIRIHQQEYKTPNHYFFDYWVSFKNSSYSTSFYSINHTAFQPQSLITYPNGTVFANVSIQDSTFTYGTYSLCFTAINNESQTNSVNASFYISLSSSSQFSIYSIANFFGGFYNFLIVVATLGGLLIAAASLHESREPPVIQITQGNKTSEYRIQGKKVKSRRNKKGGR